MVPIKKGEHRSGCKGKYGTLLYGGMVFKTQTRWMKQGKNKLGKWSEMAYMSAFTISALHSAGCVLQLTHAYSRMAWQSDRTTPRVLSALPKCAKNEQTKYCKSSLPVLATIEKAGSDQHRYLFKNNERNLVAPYLSKPVMHLSSSLWSFCFSGKCFPKLLSVHQGLLGAEEQTQTTIKSPTWIWESSLLIYCWLWFSHHAFFLLCQVWFIITKIIWTSYSQDQHPSTGSCIKSKPSTI